MKKPMNNCERIRRKWLQLEFDAFSEKSLTASREMWQEIRAHDHLMHCKVDALEKEVEELNAEIARMRAVVEAARGWVFSSPRHHGNKEAIDLVGAVIDYNSDSAGKGGE